MTRSRRPRRIRTKAVCKYRTYEEEDGTTYRLPQILVRLEHDGESFRTPALVDSGSNCSFIPFGLAEILNLPIDEESTARGAGGVFPTYISKVDISVLKGLKSIFEFKDCIVQIPRAAGDIPYVVLGRDTIFMVFEITFREPAEKMILKSF